MRVLSMWSILIASVTSMTNTDPATVRIRIPSHANHKAMTGSRVTSSKRVAAPWCCNTASICRCEIEPNRPVA